MSIVLTIVLLIFGFLLLVKGADWLVAGSSALAARLSVPPIMIGLTIVSFGTSTPELVVNVIAASSNSPAICYGNIIGSNIVNILLILGVAGLIRPLTTRPNTVWREIPFALLAVILLAVLVNDSLWTAGSENILTRGDALVLLLLFFIYLIYVFGLAKVSANDEPEVLNYSMKKIMLFILAGLVGLIIGGRVVMTNAIKIAELLGISEKVIGLTIIAVGTSLPELVTSAVAAYKNKIDIAVGNVVGSNIFNIFFILGLSGLVQPLPFELRLNTDVAVLAIATLLLFFTMFTGERKRLDRWEAVILLILYLAYTIYLFI